MINQLTSLGITSVELGFSLTESMVQAMARARRDGILNISSVHNFCPVPEGYDRTLFTPDYFSLSSPQEEERCQAVSLTRKSLHTAQQVGASALIVHAGRVAMIQRTKELVELVDRGLRNSSEYAAIVNDMTNERQRKKEIFLSAIKRSIEELLGDAQTLDIKLCLENRYYYREIPALDEFADLFDTFAGATHLGYWHDVGHAQVAENLGFALHRDFLNRYAERMIGIHLHDVVGGHDHQVPGKGNFNFSFLKPYLKKNTIMVMEVHQPATVEEMKAGMDFLKKTLSVDSNRAGGL
ncbi:MAG: TIM barrel protein [Candidatus Omnitrophica bacterium]|nr:TIM barrel protein [Candidatus Omnitrophota bacterium]